MSGHADTAVTLSDCLALLSVKVEREAALVAENQQQAQEIERLRDALERERTKRGIAFSFIPEECHEEYAERLFIVDDPGRADVAGPPSEDTE